MSIEFFEYKKKQNTNKKFIYTYDPLCFMAQTPSSLDPGKLKVWFKSITKTNNQLLEELRKDLNIDETLRKQDLKLIQIDRMIGSLKQKEESLRSEHAKAYQEIVAYLGMLDGQGGLKLNQHGGALQRLPILKERCIAIKNEILKISVQLKKLNALRININKLELRESKQERFAA